MCPGSPGSCKNPGGKNGFSPGGRRIPGAAVLPFPLTTGIFIPAAEVNTGCLKLKGDAAEKPAPNEGNKDAAAATAAEFDTDRALLVGKIDELPDPADDGRGESEGFPRFIEEGT